MKQVSDLESGLRVGDIVFTRGLPFRQVADATGTWTDHVGIVVGFNRLGVIVAESRVPLSRRTRFRRFVRRSAGGRVAVLRLPRTGEVQTFREPLERNPAADLRLWKVWYFGRIPWDRTTVTPASLYTCRSLRIVFDGTVALHRGGPP